MAEEKKSANVINNKTIKYNSKIIKVIISIFSLKMVSKKLFIFY